MVLNTASARYVGAYNVKVTDKYVVSTGRCTCSLSTGYGYSTNAFINYCPNCHHYGCIHYEINQCPQNKEGMWYCARCDMDRVRSKILSPLIQCKLFPLPEYCLVHGKSHDHRGMFLIRTDLPTNTERVEKRSRFRKNRNKIIKSGEKGQKIVKIVKEYIPNLKGKSVIERMELKYQNKIYGFKLP